MTDKQEYSRSAEELEKIASEKNLLFIDGAGRRLQDIINEYMHYIEEERYDMTLDEAAEYLRCSYSHVVNEILPNVPHLAITDKIRQGFFQYVLEGHPDYLKRDLFLKRRLLSRNAFYEYVRQHTTKKQMSHQYFFDDFSNEIMELLEAIARNKRRNDEFYEKKTVTQTMSMLLAIYGDAAKEHVRRNERKVTEKRVDELPTKLVSLRDVKEHFDYKYNVQAYRLFEQRAVSKLQINNHVRYDPNEVYKQPVFSLSIFYEKAEIVQKVQERIREDYLRLEK